MRACLAPLLLFAACADEPMTLIDTGGVTGDSPTPTDTLSDDTDVKDSAIPEDRDSDGFTVDEDCDDTDSDVYPGADEVCDGQDNDCDSDIDENNAIDATAWHRDSDGDGFGDPEYTTDACDVPDSHVPDGTDCDDTDPAISPAAVEIPEDDIDQDCDGVDPLSDLEHTASLHHADFQLTGAVYESGSGHNVGTVVADAGDVDGDGFDDVLVGDRFRASLLHGPVYGVGEVEALSILSFAAPTGESAFYGHTLAGAGDLNADGFDDIVIGTVYTLVHYEDIENAAYVLFGPAEGEPGRGCPPGGCGSSRRP